MVYLSWPQLEKMSRILNRPYLIFWMSLPILLLFGLSNRNEIITINIHDTYYVFSRIDLTFVISILFVIIGIGYWLMLKTNKKLSKWLNLIHMTLTFGGLLLIWIFAQFFRESIMQYTFNNNLTLAIYLTTLITISGQLLFLINLINAFIKKENFE